MFKSMTQQKVSPRDIDDAYAAAQCVVTTHRRLAEFLKVGQTLGPIDQFVARTLEDLKCKSCFLGYRVGKKAPFPSHACLSVNDCVVHGTAASHSEPMKPGDVLKIDVGVWHRGWVGDAAWTYVFKKKTPEVERLTKCGKECLRKGIEQLVPANRYIAWAQAVQQCVEGNAAQGGYGFHLVRGLGGHGYRYKRLHDSPYVSNVVPAYAGEWPDALNRCEPGTFIAVEPMVAVGTGITREATKEWPVYTQDGSLSVHYEHDVLITPDGNRVLTEGLDDVPDVVG
ncbi:MAG: methionyl aminopeptidase [Pyrinomonadaceae bacterium]|nr:methionyl aminopeptidase [Phycisphaerales bacterium]